MGPVGNGVAIKSNGNGGGPPLDKGKRLLRGDSSRRVDNRAVPTGTISTKGNTKGEWVPVKPGHKSITLIPEAPSSITQNNAFTLLTEAKSKGEGTAQHISHNPKVSSNQTERASSQLPNPKSKSRDKKQKKAISESHKRKSSKGPPSK
ncbi:hypothetical protein QJS10_CPA09g00703 [Acorus calamus]|uniref:Uncharacterized protein n=1 Tax=Acorus calamus TaxID=4465 RepID=A0AAV9E721_ACOCL|nr:hypothetical protein QJS10_CPA09g00703 [Acorus calamus]